jgi:hypothetical protein
MIRTQCVLAINDKIHGTLKEELRNLSLNAEKQLQRREYE